MRFLIPAVVVLAATGCASAPPCPEVKAPEVRVETPPEEAPTTKAPAELKGEFAFMTGKTKDQTVDLSAASKRAMGAGEVMIGFTEEGIALSAWQLTGKTSDKDPEHTVYALCRGRVTFEARWRGKTMILSSKIAVKGFSDGLNQQTRRDGTKTITTRMSSYGECSFSLDAGEYTFEVVASDAQGPSKLRIVNAEATFELERSAAVTTLDLKTILEGLKK